MTVLKALIIDDERKASELLKDMLNEYCPSVGEVLTCNSPNEGVKIINEFKPDILFLDIHMPEMNGFDLLDELNGFKGRIVFTTAYDQHAIKAFKYNAFDYILKPIHVEILEETVRRIEDSQSTEMNGSDIKKMLDMFNSNKDYPSSIAINDKGGLLFIKISTIRFLKAEGNYTRINCGEKEYLATKTVRSFEEMLDEDQFIRVHKSYIVNIDFVNRYSSDGGTLELEGDHWIPVSRRKRSILERFSV